LPRRFRSTLSPAAKLVRDLSGQKTLAVLCENCYVPYGIIDVQSDEPAQEQIENSTLHEHSLAAQHQL